MSKKLLYLLYIFDPGPDRANLSRKFSTPDLNDPLRPNPTR